MEKVLSTISHDIRNSLGVSAMAVNSMQRFYDKPERLQSLIATALGGLDQTDKMIQDLLDATRIREGKPISMKFEYCDLGDVVQRTYEELNFVHIVNDFDLQDLNRSWDFGIPQEFAGRLKLSGRMR